MAMAENERTEGGLLLSRVLSVLVILAGILFAAQLCVAAPAQPDHSHVSNIFDPHSGNAGILYRLGNFVLSITGLIFVVVFTLLVYVVVKFRSRAGDNGREPAQVYGSTQIELAWTVIPILIVVVLFLAAARVIHAVEDARLPAGTIEVTAIGHQFWWEFQYPGYGFITANELHVPVSDAGHPTPTHITLLSADVD